jgi:hypothetical protein
MLKSIMQCMVFLWFISLILKGVFNMQGSLVMLADMEIFFYLGMHKE